MTTRENDITESFTGDRMSILNEIAARTKERIAEEKFKVPLRKLISQQNSDLAKHAEEKISFLEALKKPGMSYICEVKKASPSKGLIAPDFPYLDIAKEYEQAGASAISCLTEPFYFQGADRYLQEISQAVNIPVLRKDFTVDEYMIYQAKAFGASAVLLICSLLTTEQLREYIATCDSLGLSALVETHDAAEIASALSAGARIIGVNNRNLSDFTVDISNTGRLRGLVPPSVLFVAESGIKGAADIAALKKQGVNAVLIGETLMRAADKKAMLDSLRTAGQ